MRAHSRTHQTTLRPPAQPSHLQLDDGTTKIKGNKFSKSSSVVSTGSFASVAEGDEGADGSVQPRSGGQLASTHSPLAQSTSATSATAPASSAAAPSQAASKGQKGGRGGGFVLKREGDWGLQVGWLCSQPHACKIRLHRRPS